MSNYFKRFATQQAYRGYKTIGMPMPNISVCTDDSDVYFNPDYKTYYLTVKCLGENGGILRANCTTVNWHPLVGAGLQASKDNGATWTWLALGIADDDPNSIYGTSVQYNDLSLGYGEVAILRGDIGDSLLGSGYNDFAPIAIDLQDSEDNNVEFELYGNFGSLFWMDEFMEHDTLPDKIDSERYPPMYGWNDAYYDTVKFGYGCIFSYTGVKRANVFYPETMVPWNEDVLSESYGRGHDPSWAGMFSSCDALEECQVCEGVKAIYDDMFKDCTSLRKLILPSTIKLIEYGRSYYTYGYNVPNLEDIVLFANVPPYLNMLPEYSGSVGQVFCNYDEYANSEYYNASLPIAYYSIINPDTIQHIYVPSNSVNAYKTNSQWSRYASKIFPISSIE